MSERILVIKLAALGDFVLAFGAFAAIRARHPDAQITLLTTAPFVELARRAPWFDTVWSDGRPPWRDWRAVLRLARRLRGGGFQRVYDLQTSGRSSRYRWLLPRSVEWSGLGRGASHRHDTPERTRLHTVERQRQQLEMAGITAFPAPSLEWLDGDVSRFHLPAGFGLLVPGASPKRPGKRWPTECFGALAAGIGRPVAILGGPAEAPLAAVIKQAAPQAVDLTGQTSFAEIAALARQAAFAVGNDTGPTHLLAAAGCPTVALFGAESDPALCAPRGPVVRIVRQQPLADLPVEQVQAALVALQGAVGQGGAGQGSAGQGSA